MMGLLICQRSGIIMVLFGSYILTKVFQKKKIGSQKCSFYLKFLFFTRFWHSTILSYSRMMIYKLAKS